MGEPPGIAGQGVAAVLGGLVTAEVVGAVADAAGVPELRWVGTAAGAAGEAGGAAVKGANCAAGAAGAAVGAAAAGRSWHLLRWSALSPTRLSAADAAEVVGAVAEAAGEVVGAVADAVEVVGAAADAAEVVGAVAGAADVAGTAGKEGVAVAAEVVVAVADAAGEMVGAVADAAKVVGAVAEAAVVVGAVTEAAEVVGAVADAARVLSVRAASPCPPWLAHSRGVRPCMSRASRSARSPTRYPHRSPRPLEAAQWSIVKPSFQLTVLQPCVSTCSSALMQGGGMSSTLGRPSARRVGGPAAASIGAAVKDAASMSSVLASLE